MPPEPTQHAESVRLPDEERDRLAEAWLTARHSRHGYIGDASYDEFCAAYDAVDNGWRGASDG